MSGPTASKAGGWLGRAAGVALKVAPWLGLGVMTALWTRARRKPASGLSQPETATPEHFEATEPGRGRMAPAPSRIPLIGWRDVLWRTWMEVNQDKLPQVAGGITFYGLLAIFPAVGVFVSLYGLFADVGKVSQQLDDLAAFVPPQVLSLVGDQMVRLATQRHATLSVAFVISLLFSVWSANAGVQALFSGLNIAYDEVEKRSFLMRRALSYGFTLAALLFITAVTSVLVAVPLYLDRWGLDDSWLVPFRGVVILVLTAVAFAFIYRFGPSRQKARWRWVRWGAGAAALAWVGGSLGFSWYVNHFAHYDVTYGSLGALVGFMMWIWFSAMVVLIGAELNAEIEHQTALDSTTGVALPMGERGAEMADTVGVAFEGLHGLWNETGRKLGKLIGRKGA